MINEMIGSVVQVMLFSFLPLADWFITARKSESFLSWIGLRKPVCRNTPLSVMNAIAATILYICAAIICIKMLPEGVTAAGSQFAGEGLKAIPSVFFYAFLRTALSEEILFRGFVLKAIKNKAGFYAGNTVQALIFGLLHGIPFGLVTKSILALALLTLLPGLFGWYQGWLNEKQCGGSIVLSWLLHGCVNFASAVLALF